MRSSEGAIVWREEFVPEIGKWEQGISVLTVTREEKAACALATGIKCHLAQTPDPRRPRKEKHVMRDTWT